MKAKILSVALGLILVAESAAAGCAGLQGEVLRSCLLAECQRAGIDSCPWVIYVVEQNKPDSVSMSRIILETMAAGDVQLASPGLPPLPPRQCRSLF